jgi:AcrR family transcriptional regulator
LGVTTTGAGVLSVSDRDRILEAMAECCVEQGYAATEVGDIVSKAGVTRGSFNSHFVDKEDCAGAAFNKLVSETMLAISTSNRPGAAPINSRVFEIKALLELATSRPSFLRLGLIDARQGGTPGMHQAYESAVKVLALMMERAHPQGSVTPSPIVVRAALGGAEALLRREIAIGRSASLPLLLQDFVYAALVPFVGQAEALRQARAAARWATEKG